MNRGTGLGLVLISSALVIILLVSLGALKVSVPGFLPDVTQNTTDVTYPELPTIVTIEPIALDCRARIEAEVPIEGRKEHKLLGQVYRTDTVSMTVVGDIDTCVSAGSVEVINRDDGSVRVIVPADAITFERPRVDTVATLDSVDYDKGTLGKLTDAFPWVSDDSGLTPAAYAYAQTVIGSTDCMTKAFDTTKRAIVRAYRDQLIQAGHDPSMITIDIVGQPDLSTTQAPEEALQGFDFAVDTLATSCTVAAGAFERGLASGSS